MKDEALEVPFDPGDDDSQSVCHRSSIVPEGNYFNEDLGPS